MEKKFVKLAFSKFLGASAQRKKKERKKGQ